MQKLFIKKCVLNGIIRIGSLKTYTISTRTYSSGVLAAGYQPRAVEETHINNVVPVKSSTDLPPYSFILPPPNVTGSLHLGHALMCTIQDVISRHRRQNGFDVCWVPGTDHAGIATQVVVEKHLQNQLGLGRHALGRNRFVEEVWKWRSNKGDRIKQDLIKMGTTMNWDKEYFTLDDRQSQAVRHAFIRLFDEGLIYRSDTLVNWSCSLESTISDIEVDNLDISGPTRLSVPGYDKPIVFGQITDMAYNCCDRDNVQIVVSTTRPETMLGDVAVAVNPNDDRYSHLRDSNTKLWHPFRRTPIPLVFDDSVDPTFGTGAVKITPAHDRFDFDLAKRHDLHSISVINEKGFIGQGFEHFAGLPRFEAREIIKNHLAQLGILRATRSHSMQLPICSRSKDIIEHILKPQWFVRCDEMSKEAIRVVETGELNIQPDNYRTDWNRWLAESRDWCISRQLWWGHNVPAYKCSIDGKTAWVAANNLNEAREKAQKHHFPNSNLNTIEVEQDMDVLDTWFSSALLPFSAFGWPDNNMDLERYYPQDLLETGHDILFFWVARMVMLGKYLTGKLPFRTVLLHGIVCDAHGRKMSKSLGNVIVPDQVIKGSSLQELQAIAKEAFDTGITSKVEFQRAIQDQSKQFPNGIPECGTDALRFTLLSHNIKSHFINFDVNECHTNKLFFNKVWQATRFIVAAHQKWSYINDDHFWTNSLCTMDRWILSRLENTIATIDRAMDSFQFHVAVLALKTFFHQNLCDVYLETTKRGLSSNNATVAYNHCAVLNICLRTGLNRMAPFTPFLVQELLPHTREILTEFKLSSFADAALEKDVQDMLDICATIRQLKSERKITRKHAPIVHLQITDPNLFQQLRQHQHDIETLTLCCEVQLQLLSQEQQPTLPEQINQRIVTRSTAGPNCAFAIELKNANHLNTTAPETTQTSSSTNDKKFKKLTSDLERLQLTIANEGFRRSASAKVQQQHQEKVERIRAELESIQRIRGKI